MCFCEVPREALNLNLMTTGLWRRRTQIASAEDSEDLVTSCDTSCLVAEAWNAVQGMLNAAEAASAAHGAVQML